KPLQTKKNMGMLKKFQEIRHGGVRNDCLGKWPLRDYVVDKFYTRFLFDMLVVPKDHALVKLNLGRVGNLIREDANGQPIPAEDDQTPIARQYRDWPGGGVFGPGFYPFEFTWFGTSQLAVVYTGQRKKSLEPQNASTKDNVEMANIDAMLTYKVVDPLQAMTAVQNSDFQGLTEDFAKARITDVIGDNTLEELLITKGERTNFVYDFDEKGKIVNKYNPPELEGIGIEIDGIRVTKYDLPKELNEALAKRAVIVANAKGAHEAAIQHGLAGKIYDLSPGAREVLFTQGASRADSHIEYDVAKGKLADAAQTVANAVNAAVREYLSNK
ncbi:MAG: hypothetical protein KC506_02565, partial [Nanoarchaeota archaeon]|nr:hypothetical protein [Nanoarchaeota archaeon]